MLRLVVKGVEALEAQFVLLLWTYEGNLGRKYCDFGVLYKVAMYDVTDIVTIYILRLL